MEVLLLHYVTTLLVFCEQFQLRCANEKNGKKHPTFRAFTHGKYSVHLFLSGGMFTHIGSATSAYSLEPADRYIFTYITKTFIRKDNRRQSISVFPFMKSGH